MISDDVIEHARQQSAYSSLENTQLTSIVKILVSGTKCHNYTLLYHQLHFTNIDCPDLVGGALELNAPKRQTQRTHRIHEPTHGSSVDYS